MIRFGNVMLLMNLKRAVSIDRWRIKLELLGFKK